MKIKEIVKKNFNEWTTQCCCQEAVELNNKIGKKYFDTASPQFFTGDIHAKLALVHLNPKRNEIFWNEKCKDTDFDAYWKRHKYFGNKVYGENSPKTHKSPFDLKQVRFLEPFGILPFNGEKYHDLEVAIDQKLQFELVPFGSPNFDYHKIGVENLKPFVMRMIDLLLECERKYIIFCGRVFNEILKDFIIKEKTHSFKLTKNDGEETQSVFEVINIRVKYNNSEITACIAPQFAKQGYPVGRYAEKVHELYGKF